MFIKIFPVGPFGSNCIIIGDLTTHEATIIDAGDDPDHIIDEIESQKLSVSHILLTHAHVDHIAAIAPVQKRFGAKVCLHSADKELYGQLSMQGRMFGLNLDQQVPPVDWALKHGDLISCQQSLTVKVLHTPGHSPGSCCFFVEAVALDNARTKGEQKPYLFCGDTLFAGSIGRTDLWGGDSDQLLESVRQHLFTLPKETIVIPGHGPQTTIGQEIKTNPFF